MKAQVAANAIVIPEGIWRTFWSTVCCVCGGGGVRVPFRRSREAGAVCLCKLMGQGGLGGGRGRSRIRSERTMKEDLVSRGFRCLSGRRGKL